MKLKRVVSYTVRHYSQVTARKVLPRPKGLPLIGTTLDLISAGGGPKLHLYVDMRHKQLGPIFTETLGPVRAIFVSDPKDMRSVFAAEGKYPVHLLPDSWLLYNKIYGSKRVFFRDGEEWHKYRQILNEILIKSEPSEGLMKAYNTATNDLVEKWSTNVDKPVNNVVSEMHQLSISYVVAALLGSSYTTHREQFNGQIEQLSSVVHLIFEESTKLNLLPAKMAATLRLPVWRRFVSAVEATLTSANKLVTELHDLASDDGVLSRMSAKGVSQEKIVSIVVDLILAGADTTPYTITWALYMLARNPDVQSRIAEELMSVSHGERMSHPLLRAVMRETLRLYPAAPFLTRALASETELSGYQVPAGEMIIMSLYTSGHSDLYFPEPSKFWPERWLRDGSALRAVNDAKASLPFALGGRSCIGRKIAEAQISLTLAEIITRFDIKVKKEIEMILMLVPVPAEPVTLYLSRKQS